MPPASATRGLHSEGSEDEAGEGSSRGGALAAPPVAASDEEEDSAGGGRPSRVERALTATVGGGAPPLASATTCSVCFDRPADAVLYRCGHQCACLQCAYYMRHERLGCPLCRAPIEDVVRVYK